MSDEWKGFCVFVLGLSVVLTSLIWALYLYNVNSLKYMSENGYTQQSIMGQSGVYWVKEDK